MCSIEQLNHFGKYTDAKVLEVNILIKPLHHQHISTWLSPKQSKKAMKVVPNYTLTNHHNTCSHSSTEYYICSCTGYLEKYASYQWKNWLACWLLLPMIVIRIAWLIELKEDSLFPMMARLIPMGCVQRKNEAVVSSRHIGSKMYLLATFPFKEI